MLLTIWPLVRLQRPLMEENEEYQAQNKSARAIDSDARYQSLVCPNVEVRHELD